MINKTNKRNKQKQYLAIFMKIGALFIPVQSFSILHKNKNGEYVKRVVLYV